jgi:hypothetical protein
MATGADSRPLGPAATAAVIAALGFVVGLAGDATHVVSGTTVYEWDDVAIWESAIWFPFAIAFSILGGAFVAEKLSFEVVKRRGRADVVTAAALVLALYALTSALRGEPTTVTVVLTGAIAVAIWAWWDPSPGALLFATAAAILGVLGEIVVVELDAAHYADDVDGLGGVAPWLPCIYFAAGAVTSQLWAAVARNGGDPAAG